MVTTIQSTIRRFSTTLALTGTCAILAACSNKNNNDWFHFGKEAPKVEPEIQEPQPHQTTPNTASEPSESQPVITTTPEPKPVLIDKPIPTPEPDVEEIVQLYRRLHVETDQAARSKLIVELLSDPREPVRLLGFDLASRDLSSGATLSPDAANAAVALLNDPLPSVRIGTTRLITRLALPDAMTLLTNTLASEHNPLVAQALLQGIQRWPNSEARNDVLRWYQSSSPARPAAASAAWAIAELELWDPQTHHPILRSVYRNLTNDQLANADLKLIASTGTHDDLDRLIALARNQDNPTQMNAAQALINSPAGVDPLLTLASTNPAFTPHAAAAIEAHRLNPNGIRRLAALTWTDDQARIESITRACDKLDHDQLAGAIKLARTDGTISDTLSIKLLSPLVAGSQSVSPRSAPGVVLLAQLELQNQRPDRTIEILSLLPSTGIDPATALNATNTKATAHILLNEFNKAAELTLNPNTWLDALNTTTDQPTKLKLAQAILDHAIELTPDQQSLINSTLDTTPTPEQP